MKEGVIRRTILRTAVPARPAQPRATWINTPGNPGTFSLSRTHPRSGGSRGWVALNAILFWLAIRKCTFLIFLVADESYYLHYKVVAFITRSWKLPGDACSSMLQCDRFYKSRSLVPRAFSLKVGLSYWNVYNKIKLFKWSKWLGQSIET